MAHVKSLVPFALLAGCSAIELPSPNPPDPWGVPISGGTMMITRDGSHAVIADPDRDRVMSLDVASGKATEMPLGAGDEPGRLVEDGAGRIHVALRRGGAVLTLADATTLSIIDRQPACGEPRGIAWDQATDLVHVACGGGELVSFPATGGGAARVLRLDRDLRDVIVSNGQLVVTRFRSAEILSLDASGAVVSRVKPPTVKRFDFSTGGGATTNGDGTVDAIAAVAWRTIALPDGRLVMSHQRQRATVLSVVHGGYGGGCGEGPVEDGITVTQPGGGTPFAVARFMDNALPVDLAVSPDGTRLAFVAAGNGTVRYVSAASLATPDQDMEPCPGSHQPPQPDEDDKLGAATSVGFLPDGALLVYYPEVPAVVVHRTNQPAQVIPLPGDLGYDSGRGLFHQQTPVGLACASCHPEGRDDGLVWTFTDEGTRRTQNLAGNIMDRAPYHWSGDMTDLPTLMDQVFAVRMAGDQPTRSQHMSLGPFLNRIPPPALVAPVDQAAVDRGKTLFEAPDVGCSTCHNGPLMSNKLLVDVGTGGRFKVPSLVGIGARAPYLHDGCAATLADRFGACGGGDLHGKTSQLTQAQIADLVAYLESL